MDSQILEKALIVLNKKGYLRTQLQDILEEEGFTSKEFSNRFADLKDLVVTIFNQFCQELDQSSAGLDQSEGNIKEFYDTCMDTFLVHKKYSFIFHDFYYITMEIEEIKDRYFELLRLRKAQLSHLFQALVKAGLFKGEMVIGQFENLINQILVMGGFWPTHSQVIFGDYHVQYYANLTFSMLVPYFTEKGLEEYHTMPHLYPGA